MERIINPATSINMASRQSTEDQCNTQKRKVDVHDLDDRNGSPACSMDWDNTDIPVPSADLESIKKVKREWIMVPGILSKLRDNPLLILNDFKHMITLRELMVNESFEYQNYALTLLLKSVKKQADNPNYHKTYYYASLSQYNELKLDDSCLSNTKYDQLVFLINTQIDAIEAEKKLIQEMRQHTEFDDFDLDNLWTLAIDYRDRYRGKYAYENQAGYLKGYFKGLTYLLKKIRQENFIPNLETLHELNQIMTDKVENHHHMPIQAVVKRDQDVGRCRIYPTKDYKEQLKKTCNESESILFPGDQIMECDYYNVRRSHQEESVYYYTSRKESCDTLQKEIESVKKLFDEYSEKLKAAQTKKEQEVAILFYVTRLERMHLFLDGNLRAIKVLWTGIRLKNKLDLMIMDNPNYLDDHSDQELLTQVESGIVNFKLSSKGGSLICPEWNSDIPYQLNQKFIFVRNIERAPVFNDYLEDKYSISATGGLDLNNTSIAVERSVERLPRKALIDNPLHILNNPELYFSKLRCDIETQSLDQQYEILTSLLDFVQKQQANPAYCNTYCYAHIEQNKTLKLDDAYLSKTEYDQLVFLIKTQIDAIEAEKTLIQEMSQHTEFDDFDWDNLWKLVIAPKDHEKGKYAYENQAGYLKGYFKGLTFVLKKIRLGTFSPTWETLRELNQVMTDQVENEDRIPIWAYIKTDGDKFLIEIIPTHDYIEQLKKIDQWTKGVNSIGWLEGDVIECKYYQIYLSRSRFIYFSRKDSCNTLKKEVENVKKLFDEFSEKSKAAKTADEKELAILFYVINLARMRLFVDGNIRAINVLWMGIRLINKLDLIIMNDPFDLYSHSDQELVYKVNSGIMNFKSLLKLDAPWYQACCILI